MEKIKELIADLESESNDLKEMIIKRIQSIHDEDLRDAMLEDPFSLDLLMEDNEMVSYHGYDIGRLESFIEIANELKKIINE